MERRRAATVAGAAAVTVCATVLGLGATFGLFGLTEPDSGGTGTARTPVAAVSAAHRLAAPATVPATPVRDD
jgi:hypothetical protein